MAVPTPLIGCRRLRAIAFLVATGVALVPTAAWADLTISVENPNSRGQIDVYEIFDVHCDRQLSPLSLAGRTSGTLTVCGGLDDPGDIRIRYNGSGDWTDYKDIRSWSILTLPSRPADRAPVGKRPGNDD